MTGSASAWNFNFGTFGLDEDLILFHDFGTDFNEDANILIGLWNVRAGLCATAILAPAEHRAVARGPAEHGQGVILHEGGQSELLVCVKWSEHCRGRGELPFY